MNTLRLIFHEDRIHPDIILIMVSVFAGFTSINLILLSQAADTGSTEPSLFLVSLVVMAIATLARQVAMLRTIVILERTILDLRLGFLERLARIELYEYERIGADTIYDKLSTATRLLSETAGIITKLLILAARGVAVLCALVWISQITLFILVFIGLVIIIFYLWIPYQKPAIMEDYSFFATFEHLLKGFKEIKINRRKGDELCELELAPLLAESQRVKIAEGKHVSLSYVMTEGILLVLGGLMIFIFPVIFPEYASVAVKAALIVITLPTSMLRDAPVIANADDALVEMTKLTKAIDKVCTEKISKTIDQGIAVPFQLLELIDICFRYTDINGNPTFHVGPISINIASGSLNFIVGSNGSGKSTLMKVLTGLYPSFSGEVRLNGQSIDMAAHRYLFSVIFYEFHLFDRLYGMSNLDPNAVNRLLAKMGLGNKLSYAEGNFSNIDLSTGQRKRIALAIALLEDHPIYVLDEWAADQDPQSRENFYLELLPALKKKGKAIIVVTHDDRYFHVADQIIHMENGQMTNA